MTSPPFIPSFAAEFPNDNPALHRGSSWVVLTVTGPPRAVVRASAGAPRRVTADEVERVAPRPTLTDLSEVWEASFVVEAVADDVADAIADWLEPPRAEPWGDFEAVLIEPWVLEVRVPEVPAPVGAASEAAVDETKAAEAVSQAEAMRIADAAPEETLIEEAITQPPPEVVAVEPEAKAELPAPPIEVVAEASEPETSTDEGPEEADSFAALLDAMVAVALDAGCTRAAAVVPPLVRDGVVDAAHLDDAMLAGLTTAGVAEVKGSRLITREQFRATGAAWGAVLRGETDDLSACGTSTLDGWAVEVLAALGVGDEKALKRSLRGRGVAAFGMLVAA